MNLFFPALRFLFVLLVVGFTALAKPSLVQAKVECYVPSSTGTCRSTGIIDADECPAGTYPNSASCTSAVNGGFSAPGGLRNPAVPGAASSQAAAYSGSLIGRMINNTLLFVMVIATLLVLLNFVEAAINWISAGGDTSKVQKARDKITQAVIGLIILSATVVIWQIVKTFLGIQLNFPTLFG